MLGRVSTADTLENGGEPRPVLRWAAVGLVLVVVVAVVFVSIHRAADRRAARNSFDRMLTLAAGAQAAVERAVSEERDTAQSAEPLLNSSLTASATRQQLYITVSASARRAQAEVDTQLQQLRADPTGRTGRLRDARDATLDISVRLVGSVCARCRRERPVRGSAGRSQRGAARGPNCARECSPRSHARCRGQHDVRHHQQLKLMPAYLARRTHVFANLTHKS